jgi:hypothetical protein
MMRGSMRCALRAAVAVLLLAGFRAPTGADEKPRPAATAKGLEELLKEAHLDYSVTQGKGSPTYKVPVEYRGDTTMVYAREHTLGHTKAGDLKAIQLSCVLLLLDKGTEVPAAMTKRMAELNDRTMLGKISMGKLGEQTFIAYSTASWLQGLDPELLKFQLYITHQARLQLRKELEPYLKE